MIESSLGSGIQRLSKQEWIQSFTRRNAGPWWTTHLRKKSSSHGKSGYKIVARFLHGVGFAHLFCIPERLSAKQF